MENTRNTSDREKAAGRGFNGLPGFCDLSESVKQELKAICRARSYTAGNTIAGVGMFSDHVGIVFDGILCMQKMLPDGRQHVVGLLVPGDLFGRVFEGDIPFSIEAATDAGIFIFQRAEFEAILLRNRELDRLLVLNTLSELDRARDWMILLTKPKIRARLAGFLLLLCTRFQAIDHLVTVADRSIRVQIPLSRPDVAHLLGTRVESVSRALHALADDGLIDILRPDLVDIRRIKALAEEVGEPDLGDPSTLEDLVRCVRKLPD